MEKVSASFGVGGLVVVAVLCVGLVFLLRWAGVLTYVPPPVVAEQEPPKLSAEVKELIEKLKRSPAEFLALAGDPGKPKAALARKHIFPVAALGSERKDVIKLLLDLLRGNDAAARRDAARTLGLFELSTDEMRQFLLIPSQQDAEAAADVFHAVTLNEQNLSRYATNIVHAMFDLVDRFRNDRVLSAALAGFAKVTRHIEEADQKVRVRSFLFDQVKNNNLTLEDHRAALHGLLPLLNTNFEDLVELFDTSRDEIRAEILSVTAKGIQMRIFPDAAQARELICRVLESEQDPRTVFDAAIRAARESFGKKDLPRLQEAFQKNADDACRQAIFGIINVVGEKKE